MKNRVRVENEQVDDLIRNLLFAIEQGDDLNRYKEIIKNTLTNDKETAN